ncbi:MAG: hypothetical protein ACLP50_35505 [Solirubrobacteraceae bacterium]
MLAALPEVVLLTALAPSRWTAGSLLVTVVALAPLPPQFRRRLRAARRRSAPKPLAAAIFLMVVRRAALIAALAAAITAIISVHYLTRVGAAHERSASQGPSDRDAPRPASHPAVKTNTLARSARPASTAGQCGCRKARVRERIAVARSAAVIVAPRIALECPPRRAHGGWPALSR